MKKNNFFNHNKKIFILAFSFLINNNCVDKIMAAQSLPAHFLRNSQKYLRELLDDQLVELTAQIESLNSRRLTSQIIALLSNKAYDYKVEDMLAHLFNDLPQLLKSIQLIANGNIKALNEYTLNGQLLSPQQRMSLYDIYARAIGLIESIERTIADISESYSRYKKHYSAANDVVDNFVDNCNTIINTLYKIVIKLFETTEGLKDLSEDEAIYPFIHQMESLMENRNVRSGARPHRPHVSQGGSPIDLAQESRRAAKDRMEKIRELEESRQIQEQTRRYKETRVLPTKTMSQQDADDAKERLQRSAEEFEARAQELAAKRLAAQKEQREIAARRAQRDDQSMGQAAAMRPSSGLHRFGAGFAPGSAPGSAQRFGAGSVPGSAQRFGAGSTPGSAQRFGAGSTPGSAQEHDQEDQPASFQAEQSDPAARLRARRLAAIEALEAKRSSKHQQTDQDE